MQTLGSLYIENTYFIDNFAEESTHGVLMIQAKVFLINCFSQFTDSSIGKNVTISNDMGGFARFSLTTFFIKSSLFLNGLANKGGALYLSGKSSGEIISSNFSNNFATFSGGAIFAKSI